MLIVVDYIRKHGLQALAENFGVLIKRHSQFPQLVMLKYHQIDSPLGNPVVQQCRGLILDESKDWAVVSFPYTKFFNHGEGHAADIDWSSAVVYEKLDGSLMTLYFNPYSEAWEVASSGDPEASGQIMSLVDTRFCDLFWKTWSSMGYRLPNKAASQFCFMFELMTPFNRIVVPQMESKIVLHGVRLLDSTSGWPEMPPEDAAEQHGWLCVRSFKLSTIEDIIKSAQSIDPMEQEGYVIRDADFNRLKVKSPQYVAIHHVKDSMSVRRMIEIVRTNEGSEFLTYFPELRGLYEQVRERFDVLFSKLEHAWETHRHIADQKEFALAIKGTPCSGILFGLRNGKCDSIRSGLIATNIRNLERELEADKIDVSGLNLYNGVEEAQAE